MQTELKPLRIDPYLTLGAEPEDQIEWKTVDVSYPGGQNYQNFGVEVPANWSDNAVQALATKYFFRGVSEETLIDTVQLKVSPRHSKAMPGEWSLKQVAWRISHFWRMWGEKLGYFIDTAEADVFEKECRFALYAQIFHPNSPQWFNTGVYLYGIRGNVDGTVCHSHDNPSLLMKLLDGSPALDHDPNIFTPIQAPAYERPCVHACHLVSVRDAMFGEASLSEDWITEARLFKYGSGVGTNWSTIRGRGEPISAGGVASGLLSFLKVPNAIGGVIKSGGTTRRAAKMVSVDADHPEIFEFVSWKASEERAALALVDHGYSAEFNKEGGAYERVDGQNSNNSVAIPKEFWDVRNLSLPWFLISRTPVKINVPGARENLTRRHPQGTYIEVPDFKFGSFTVNKLIRKDPQGDWYAVLKETTPDKILDVIARAAWVSADPGVHHLDLFEEFNPVKKDGKIRTANPCSEYLFLDDTSCNLACANLLHLDRKSGRREFFAHVVRLMTFVLDITVSYGSLPSELLARGAFEYRTLGIGYAGLGALLMQVGLAYDSEEARKYAAHIQGMQTLYAWQTSAELAQRLGPFPAYGRNKEHLGDVLERHAKAAESNGDQKIADELRSLRTVPMRNAFVTLVMPAGTVGITLDAKTTGIEPYFSLVSHKKLSDGTNMQFACPSVKPALTKLGYSSTEAGQAVDYVASHGTILGWDKLKKEHESVFATAVSPDRNEIRWKAHIDMLGAVQPLMSGAVSKTINMPRDATIDDIKQAYIYAHTKSVKCVALYRDGCKLSQPMNVADPAKQEANREYFNQAIIRKAKELVEAGFGDPPLADMIHRRTGAHGIDGIVRMMKEDPRDFWDLLRKHWSGLPVDKFRKSYTVDFTIMSPRGSKKFYLTVGTTEDGQPIELFIRTGLGGNFQDAVVDALAMKISYLLQQGIPLKKLLSKYLTNKYVFEPAGMTDFTEPALRFANNFIELIMKILARRHLTPEEQAGIGVTDATNGKSVVVMENHSLPQVDDVMRILPKGMKQCPSCGTPVKAWGCDPCPSCGHKEGGCGG